MSTQHTPGPWRDNGLVIETENGVDICLMGEPAHWSGGTPNMCPNDEANARLIAAAPELLGALQKIAGMRDGEQAWWARDIAAAAIAKATGAA